MAAFRFKIQITLRFSV